MVSQAEAYGWAVGMALLVALAIPWFLWGTETIVAGLPIWLWWHIGWMVLAAITFWAFTRRAWGIGVVPGGGDGS